jgi:CubicO group peptidase (beta-lactamase class C family)
MADDIETSFQAAIDAGKINGVVICATDAEGRFVYEKALGERTLLSGEKRPQRLDDVLYLASATKLIATIAALQCVEDGLLTLTGDLSSVAPELAAKQVLTGFSDDGETPLLEPPPHHARDAAHAQFWSQLQLSNPACRPVARQIRPSTR